LVTEGYVCKVADFGLSTLIEGESSAGSAVYIRTENGPGNLIDNNNKNDNKFKKKKKLKKTEKN